MSAGAAGERPRPERWTRLAWLVFALFVASLLVLGSRPGGRLPIFLYQEGRFLLAFLALVALAIGVVSSVRHRPFRRPGRVPALVALVFVIGVVNYPFPYPTSFEDRPSRVAFRLPVEGEWKVFWGGESPQTNRLAAFYPDRRYGLHLVVERDGRTHTGDGERAGDYLAFGRPVLAPAAGRVVSVHDGERDRARRDEDPGGPPFGNRVVLEVAPGEFCWLTHLRRGSIRVREGEQVEAGQVLGEVGWSGRSPATPEPHVECFLASSPDPGRGEAIPWRFENYLADGVLVASGLPRGGVAQDGHLLGQRVRQAPTPLADEGG